jgi:hypothetical protein
MRGIRTVRAVTRSSSQPTFLHELLLCLPVSFYEYCICIASIPTITLTEPLTLNPMTSTEELCTGADRHTLHNCIRCEATWQTSVTSFKTDTTGTRPITPAVRAMVHFSRRSLRPFLRTLQHLPTGAVGTYGLPRIWQCRIGKHKMRGISLNFK